MFQRMTFEMSGLSRGEHAAEGQVDRAAHAVEILVAILRRVQRPGNVPRIARLVGEPLHGGDDVLPVTLRFFQQAGALGLSPLGEQLGHLVQAQVADGVGIGEVADALDIARVGHVTDELPMEQAAAGIVRLLLREISLADDPLAAGEDRRLVRRQPGRIVGQAGVLGHRPEGPAVAGGPGSQAAVVGDIGHVRKTALAGVGSQRLPLPLPPEHRVQQLGGGCMVAHQVQGVEPLRAGVVPLAAIADGIEDDPASIPPLGEEISVQHRLDRDVVEHGVGRCHPRHARGERFPRVAGKREGLLRPPAGQFLGRHLGRNSAPIQRPGEIEDPVHRHPRGLAGLDPSAHQQRIVEPARQEKGPRVAAVHLVVARHLGLELDAEAGRDLGRSGHCRRRQPRRRGS